MVKEKELLIEITNKCPLNCIYCSSNSNVRKNTFIDKKILKKIILDAKKVGIEVIQLSGGEPFQHPDINEIIDFILKKGLKLEIYTCGNAYINGEYHSIPKDFIKYHEGNPNLTLRFNFQTIDLKAYEYLTNNPLALKNLIISIKNCTSYNINTEVHIVPTNINIKQLDSTINYLINELHISHIKILRLIFHGRAQINSEILIFDENELYNKIYSLKQKFENSKVEIGSAFSILSNTCTECQAGINKFMITTDLKLFPCTAFKNRTDCYIRVNHQNSLKKIITHQLIHRKLQSFNEHLKCNYCISRVNCIEICPIQKMICKRIIKSDILSSLFKQESFIRAQ